MKKLILLGFLVLQFSINDILSQNLIVDKNSINQYDHDNYVYFNSFNFDGDYQGNHANNPPAPDVFDLLGKQVMREFITDKLDISCLEQGTYIINLKDGINTSSHKIIKN